MIVLGPIAEEFGADLYLPSGEISDSMLHTMARTGAEDGRGWRDQYGVEQTEIDAIATLQPDVLEQITRDALALMLRGLVPRVSLRRCGPA